MSNDQIIAALERASKKLEGITAAWEGRKCRGQGRGAYLSVVGDIREAAGATYGLRDAIAALRAQQEPQHIALACGAVRIVNGVAEHQCERAAHEAGKQYGDFAGEHVPLKGFDADAMARFEMDYPSFTSAIRADERRLFAAAIREVQAFDAVPPSEQD